jgi:lipoprotein-releasing system permease protein
MNLPLLFARRYLLGRRGRNAVNTITLISIVVMAVVTAAMVVVLSTMNGISDLVDTIYSPFDQDLTVSAVEGKTFAREAVDSAAVMALPGVQDMSWVIEENVLLRSGDQQAVATMKAVEPQYLVMSGMPEHMYSGRPELVGPDGPKAIIGIGLKTDLSVPLDDGVFSPLEISAPVRGRKLSTYRQGAFEQADVPVAGAFTINMEFDTRYVLVPLGLGAELLHYDSAVSALEVSLAPGSDADATARLLRPLLPEGLRVRTRHQKNELMYRTNETEKWFTFAVLVFIGLIGAFNVIASLTMMMIEKERDMRVLVSMGATPRLVRTVFFLEGVLIDLAGIGIGLLLGLGLCWAQQRFGLIALSGSVVESYPVKVLPADLLLIFSAVLVIGLLASWVPLRALSRRYLQATAVKL